MNVKIAEEIAMSALEYLSVNEEYFANFIAYCGISPEEIKDSVNSDDFKISILDYICLDESLLLSFCDAMQIEAGAPYKAYQYLSHYR